MQQLTINPKFRDVARPLHENEFKLLEENILKDGRVIQPIITWNGTIIDGHNRWTIIQKHPEIPYSVEKMEFADEWAVVVWICNNQLGRRNLTDEERTFLYYQEQQAECKSHGAPIGNQNAKKQRRQNGAFVSEKTSSVVAKRHGVSSRTIDRAVQFGKGVDKAEALSTGVKDTILSGKTGVPKSVVAEIPKMEPEQQAEVVQKIKSGLPWGKEERVSSPEPEPEIKPAFEPKTNRRSASKEMDKRIADAVADLYTQDRVMTQKVGDLLELLELTAASFAQSVRHTLQHYSTVLSDEAVREKVISVLSETETEIQKLKGLLL